MNFTFIPGKCQAEPNQFANHASGWVEQSKNENERLVDKTEAYDRIWLVDTTN